MNISYPKLSLSDDGSVMIVLPSLPPRAASLSIERGQMVDSTIIWEDEPIATLLPGGYTYSDAGLIIGNIYYYRAVAVNTGGSTPGPSVSIAILPPKPPAPGDIIFSNVKATRMDISKDFTFNSTWTHLFVYRKVGSNWNQWGTEITDSENTSYLEDLIPNSVESFKFGAVGLNGTSFGPVASMKMNSTEEFDAPEKPNPPTIGDDHSSHFNSMNLFSYQELNVTMPAWSLSTTSPVEGMELWMNAGQGYFRVGNYSSEEEIKIPVGRCKTYSLKDRAFNTVSNVVQYSTFSDEATVSFISDTCSVTINSPVAGSVHLIQLISANILDTAADIETHSTGIQNVEFYIRNLPLSNIEIDSPEYTNDWDTRQFLNGEANVDVYALGSDDNWTKASIEVSINNTLSNNTIYKEFKLQIQRPGYDIVTPYFGLDSYGIVDSNLRKGWMQLGVRTGGNPLAITSQDQDLESWWKTFKAIPFSRGTSWGKDNGNNLIPVIDPELAILTQYYNCDELDTYGRLIYFALKVSPYENVAGYKVNADKILKIRNYVKGGIFVLTSGPSLVYNFDGESLGEGIAIHDYYSDIDVLDAAQASDDIYIVTLGHELVRLDITTGEIGETVETLDETKEITHIETLNPTTVMLFYEGLDDDNNPEVTAYTKQPGINKKLWNLSAMINKIYFNNGNLAIADGKKLYVSNSSSGIPPQPVLSPYIIDTQDDFPDNIVSIYGNLVLLENGDLYEFKASSSSWSLVVSSGRTDLTGVSRNLEGNEIYLSSTTTNLEFNGESSWQDNQVLSIKEIDMDNLTDVTEMWNLDSLVTAASGTIGSEGYAKATYSSKLIMAMSSATGTYSAVLVVVEKSSLSENSGAVLVSEINNISATVDDLQLSGLPHRVKPTIENSGGSSGNFDVGPGS